MQWTQLLEKLTKKANNYIETVQNGWTIETHRNQLDPSVALIETQSLKVRSSK